MSLAAVHDLQKEGITEEARRTCCAKDCLNATLTTSTIHKRRFQMGEMDQQTKRNFLVNEISSFAEVESVRYPSHSIIIIDACASINYSLSLSFSLARMNSDM